MSESTQVVQHRETLAHMQTRSEVLCERAEDPSLSAEERNEALQELEHLFRTELPRKVDNVALVLREFQNKQSMCKAAIRFAEEKLAMWEKRERDLRNLVRVIMQVSEVKTYRGALTVITLKPPAKSVQVFSTALLPLQYFVIEPPKLKINRTAIRHALENNVEVPGARLVPGDDILEVR